jgi:predicted RNase H-like nuclease (RuvC/YqgF family)
MSVSGLKERVASYCDIDNKIREKNAEIQELRRIRSEAEMNIIEIMSSEEFKEHEKIRVSGDGSYIRILRPNKWNKPWSLSKNLLKQILVEYDNSKGSSISEECFEFICETMKPMLVSESYSIERIVK